MDYNVEVSQPIQISFFLFSLSAPRRQKTTRTNESKSSRIIMMEYLSTIRCMKESLPVTIQFHESNFQRWFSFV